MSAFQLLTSIATIRQIIMKLGAHLHSPQSMGCKKLCSPGLSSSTIVRLNLSFFVLLLSKNQENHHLEVSWETGNMFLWHIRYTHAYLLQEYNSVNILSKTHSRFREINKTMTITAPCVSQQQYQPTSLRADDDGGLGKCLWSLRNTIVAAAARPGGVCVLSASGELYLSLAHKAEESSAGERRSRQTSSHGLHDRVSQELISMYLDAGRRQGFHGYEVA